MKKYYLHEERCSGVLCILKENCKLHKIPFELAKVSIRNFLVKVGENYHCNKYEPIKDLEKEN